MTKDNFCPERIVDELAAQTDKLVKNMVVLTEHDIQTTSGYCTNISLKEYIRRMWNKKHQEQEEKRIETTQFSRPTLSYDATSINSIAFGKGNEEFLLHETESFNINEDRNLTIHPPENRECFVQKKFNSLDYLNSHLSDLLKKQLKHKKKAKSNEIIIETEENENKDKESGIENDSYSTEYDSDQEDQLEDTDVELSDTSIVENDEIIIREKPAFSTKIIESENENTDNDTENTVYDDSSLLDLLSGQFIHSTKSKYVDVEADEEDDFGQVVTNQDNEEERISNEKKWLEEANEILAKGKEELMIPDAEDAHLVRALYRQQHIEEDKHETLEILEQLNYKRREREDERQLHAIRKRKQLKSKQNDPKQDISLFDHVQIEEFDDSDEHAWTHVESSEFKQWRTRNQQQSEFNFFALSYKKHEKSSSTITDGHEKEELKMKNQNRFFLQSGNVHRLSKLGELSLEKEKQAVTFKKL